MTNRRWVVAHGYYMDRSAYEGPSTFLAGLNYARINRRPYSLDRGGHGMGVCDMESMDEDGDRQTDDEKEFFELCAGIGSRFKWRSTYDHSKNWKTKEEWARIESERLAGAARHG